jgi:D-tyrosyl-tRNA(Tyr) deacylase
MLAVVQRVSSAGVEILSSTSPTLPAPVSVKEEPAIRAVGPGMMILLGVEQGDRETESDWLAAKCAALRIFPDEAGKMNLSVHDVCGEALVVSQFTLAGDCRKGNRPGFERAAKPEIAVPLYERFCRQLQAAGVPVKTGVFAATMRVTIVNEGPVTLIVRTPQRN